MNHDGDGRASDFFNSLLGHVTGVFAEGYDVSERVRALDHLKFVIDELNHRVKNTLATIQSIASQSFSDRKGPAAQDTFQRRLMAMAAAHDLLTRDSWEGAGLEEVIQQALAPFAKPDCGRLSIDGPSIFLKPSAVLAIALAFHELATNATKYGSFSTPAGQVSITWTVDSHLNLLWQEMDGPKVSVPTRSGFGTRLLQKGLAHDLGGAVQIEFQSEGLRCSISAPLQFVEAGTSRS